MIYLLPCCQRVGNWPVWLENMVLHTLYVFGVDITFFLATELRGVKCFEWGRFFFDGAYVLPSFP